MKDLIDVPAPAIPVAEAIAANLSRVIETFDRAVASDVPPVKQLVAHVEHYRGKMLRPIMVLACGMAAHPGAAGAATGQGLGSALAQWSALLTREHMVCAAVVEMVHMATLVHDDVLDEADVRRRGKTVNALEGNEAAVILGDYLIAAAYALCSSLDTPHASREIGDAARVVCSGELLQLSNRGNFDLPRGTYDQIVDMKTAALIACACRLGAWASGAQPNVIYAMGQFGREIGIAFQIQDDVLDLTGDQSVVGKSVRKDLEKGKLTLPLIHHLENASDRERSLALLRELSTPSEIHTPAHDRALAELLAGVEATKSVGAARDQAQQLVASAVGRLDVLDASPARELLVATALAVVGRAF